LTPRWIKENKNLTIPPDGTRKEEEEKNPPHIFIRDERGGERERVGERFLLILGREPSVCASARYLE
jgi:hypothetical protein